MKKLVNYKLITILVLIIAFLNCGEEKAPQMPSGPSLNPTASVTGKVTEAMNSGGYTYMKLDVNGADVWIAASQMQINNGDMVTFMPTTPMKDFHSKTLNKTFADIYFVSGVQVDGKPVQGNIPNMPQQNAHQSTTTNTQTEKANIKPGSIPKAQGGYTVAEVYLLKSNLSGKTVSVRGKVIKYSEGIMGKNWLHLQDGTGKEGQNDLTVTTQSTSKVGDTVLISGKASYDKDIGSGYFYPVIIEDAVIK